MGPILFVVWLCVSLTVFFGAITFVAVAESLKRNHGVDVVAAIRDWWRS